MKIIRTILYKLFRYPLEDDLASIYMKAWRATGKRPNNVKRPVDRVTVSFHGGITTNFWFVIDKDGCSVRCFDTRAIYDYETYLDVFRRIFRTLGDAPQKASFDEAAIYCARAAQMA